MGIFIRRCREGFWQWVLDCAGWCRRYFFQYTATSYSLYTSPDHCLQVQSYYRRGCGCEQWRAPRLSSFFVVCGAAWGWRGGVLPEVVGGVGGNPIATLEVTAGYCLGCGIVSEDPLLVCNRVAEAKKNMSLSPVRSLI